MAVRTTDDLVKGVLLSDYGETDDGDEPDLDPFIASASVIVDRLHTMATAAGYALTGDELELIERWLAAHCYCCSDQPFHSNRTMRGMAVYQGQTGLRLNGTKYGQMALLLDTSGMLEQLNSQKKVKAVWLGRYPTAQTDYVDKR